MNNELIVIQLPLYQLFRVKLLIFTLQKQLDQPPFVLLPVSSYCLNTPRYVPQKEYDKDEEYDKIEECEYNKEHSEVDDGQADEYEGEYFGDDSLGVSLLYLEDVF